MKLSDEQEDQLEVLREVAHNQDPQSNDPVALRNYLREAVEWIDRLTRSPYWEYEERQAAKEGRN